MCKYEMDAMSILEDTERTRFCPQTDIFQTDKVKPVYPPFNFVEAEGILSRELGPSGVSPNQRSRWKHVFSPLKHV